MIKRILSLAILLLAVAGGAAAQDVSSRYQGQIIGSRGVPLANQNIAVCSQPANTNTQPCSPLISLGTSTSTTTGGLNPLTSDAIGNFFFYAAPGKYTIQIYGPQVGTQLVQPDTLVGSSGPGVFTTFTASGTATFTGTINCTIINSVRCISPSNPQGWAGADPIAWINSAYANCAAASLVSCPIQVAAGTYPSSTTLLNFSTLGVFPQLQCAPETVITFSATSGTAITVNPGRNGVITDWGIQGCHFVGSGLGNTLTGHLAGGTNGAVGEALRGVHINGFNIGLTFGTNVQGWLLDHSSVGDNNQQIVLPSGQTQTGEGLIFQNNTFFHSTAWSPTCISIANAGATIYNLHFIGGSIDECGVSIGNGSHVVFNQVHFENPINIAVTSAFVTCTGGVCDFNGSQFTSEQTSFNPGCSVVASCFVDAKSGAQLNAYGNQAINSGNSAMSGFVHVCATCTGMSGGNSVGFGTQPLPAESVDVGGTFARITGNSVGLYGGNNTSGSFWIANSGATVGGVTGTFFGCLQPGVANLCEIDTSGNLGMLGRINGTGTPGIFNATGTQQNNSHTVQDTATLAAGTVTVTFTGSSVFTNATSYTCIADDDTAIAATRVLQNSGSSITVTGTGTDVIRYICVGN